MLGKYIKSHLTLIKTFVEIKINKNYYLHTQRTEAQRNFKTHPVHTTVKW